MEKSFRLLDFNAYDICLNEDNDEYNSEEDYNNENENNNSSDNENNQKEFIVQMFGLDENGKTASIFVQGYKPFFYAKIPEYWNKSDVSQFTEEIRKKLGKKFESSLLNTQIVNKKKLYGFDSGAKHQFVLLRFSNTIAMNRAKYLWYKSIQKEGQFSEKKLIPGGFLFNNEHLELYEANIPPLLRLFHIKEISPTGWIALPKKRYIQHTEANKSTSCDFEFTIDYRHIIPLGQKESPVPFKIMSFDIEASSSHGDFPLPIKNYRKLAENIVDYKNSIEDEDILEETLINLIKTAFGYSVSSSFDSCIDKVYTKFIPTESNLITLINKCLKEKFSDIKKQKDDVGTLFKFLKSSSIIEEEEDDLQPNFENKNKNDISKEWTIINILNSNNCSRSEKIEILIKCFAKYLPNVLGDKVTFIGSTFLKYGDDKPYLNHCIVLDTCETPENVENVVIDSYKSEKEVLLAWQNLVQKENPDIIIGYNIFGFDYEFMFRRSLELDCAEDFLKLSRNKSEICAKFDGEYKIETQTVVIASGQHDFRFIKMNGRVQIDMYNYLRRDYNLTSYKLDYVAGYFIGDSVKKIENDEINLTTKIYSKNLIGLEIGNYINFEESSHSSDMYKDGEKFMVENIDYKNNTFIINGIENPDMTKSVKWGLAKDDVSPQDIFRMTNGSAADRAVIAKYCIQDCNLVHHLLKKIDVITGYIEMAKLCSVPMSFLVFRGQGIKLTSYIAKKCREKDTLMPTIDKGNLDDNYEGAIVLEPKTGLYLDNPVACLDYAALYPSEIIADNISHDSKVWTKEYDLQGRLVKETGEKNKDGSYKYDNLPEYKYVDITYDTFRWVRKTPKGAAEKVQSGTKTCRFAQFPEGKAVMPSILEELLAARKATRKQIPLATDAFMANVLDKRQLAIKVTANSMYGQCGAKTSSFYEMDVAASTTAGGRKLLTYAKKIVEQCYANRLCETKNYGTVLTNAEYVYGDTDSVFFTFNLATPEGKPIRGKEALEITIELAQEAGHLASSFLKPPHDLEYEKTFMPFCLLSKKRYVGMLYETDPNKCYRKSMGIVLKRRDNAPIVKDIYGGIIDILMKSKGIETAANFLKESLDDIVNKRVPIEKLIITKSLRSGYKNPQQIAHKVLADRMAARDAGNKPAPGDRIPFAYIHSGPKALQGEKIEHPKFIKERNLKIDYSFYITNQIMKPVLQVFGLVLEDMPAFRRKRERFLDEIETIKYSLSDQPEKLRKKISTMRDAEVQKLLFDDYINKAKLMNSNQIDIRSMFSVGIKK